MNHVSRLVAPILCLAASVGPSFAAEPGPAEIEFFEKKIRPVLVENCYSCHSADAEKQKKLKAGLYLDTKDGLLKGGDSGPAIAPGQPADSLLVQSLKYDGDFHMPPKGKLPDAVIADFEKWVAMGAPDPRTDLASGGRKPPVSGIDIEAGKRFWSFRPPQPHDVPAVRDRSWPRGKIDAFILARLEQAGLKPAPEADRRTLVRRLSFDLTGLPPTPEEVEAFVADTSPDAYEKVVEKLLASPRHGERWARVWLDVARYAEDQAHIVGNDISLTYPNAYLYRDWVIRALNEDLPYDKFIKLQLAADLIEGEDSENLAALGFVGLGPKYYSRNALAVMADEWEDRVDVVGRGLLGLTVACARCHDHKYDPIRTEDYYGLAGVFAGTKMFNRPLSEKAEKKPDGEAKAPGDAMHVVREGTPTDLTVFVRGDVKNKGPVAPRHFPAVLCDGPPRPLSRGSGRQELADAVADPKNPLTARVIVNRIWAAYFGRGIVPTASNFGSLGERPTHPELLDDLAVRFVENGWSFKWLHREIVLSATYRQSSRADAKTRAADADNLLLGRMPRRRLGVEGWRDAVLAAAGRLDTAEVGGKSIDPLDPKGTRRTVYSQVSRLELNRFLALFDFPDPNATAERRAETTTPLQKLFVLNSPFMLAQAEALARRLHEDVSDETSEGDRKRIDRAYRVLFARPPSEAEVDLGLKYLAGGDDPAARWRQYAHVLLASNEMLFVD
jgi:hypothetical protein